MTLPKKIDPCPIIDALVEIRFSTKIHPNAVFGLFYNALQSDFDKVENLPILQLPDTVRSSDPSFKFKPHYKITSNKFVVQIGPEVISVSSFPEYIGWDIFSNKIFDVLTKVEEVNIIKEIHRIGIRYINFFENDIYQNINLNVNLGDKQIPYNNTVIRTEFEQETYKSTLQIANNANNNGKLGSVIDIDTYLSTEIENFFTNKEDYINNGHEKEKQLFFSLLKDNFLKTLNPQY